MLRPLAALAAVLLTVSASAPSSPMVTTKKAAR
jgi:hypothetical protein